MGHPGYKWSLSPENGGWRWSAVDRDNGTIFLEGLANSRAEAAAYLAKAMTVGVLGSFKDEAAA